jgi:hypothetical protein
MASSARRRDIPQSSPIRRLAAEWELHRVAMCAGASAGGRTVNFMTTPIITAMIAGGSAIVGGLIVARSNYAISRRRAKDVRQGGLRETHAALLSALTQVDQQLRSEPRSKRTVRVINEQMAARFPQIDYVTGRIHRRLFQPQLDQLVVRFHDAMAANLLAAPPELVPALDELNAVMARVDQNSEDWWCSWDEARADLILACRDDLGELLPAA